ncbi:MAG: glycosyltransferase family 1 protein [bacterium]|nr:glycosyltransferase family 1 protein [bacterium]
MRVALVKPPIGGHGSRGIGFYGQRLFEALKKIVDVNWIDFSLSPYQNFDIVHYPYFDLFWPTLPPIRNYKTVVTVHDLTPLKFPEHFPLGLRAKIVWPWQKLLLQHVDAVITDSYCSKKDIEAMTGAKNVNVTYLAADAVFKPLNLKRDNFALYVGGANWNKNVISLVRACQKIKMSLVIVGKEFTSTPNEHIENKPLKEILDLPAGRQARPKILGFVETEELVKLYNQARVYVQPSVYEGFGLPILEAMACGTPVICGKNSSLQEIGGDAVTYADVTNVDDLAEKITHIKDSGQAGMTKQANKFSWEKCAKETYEVYKKI